MLPLFRIRRLYRSTHATFEDYCRGRWSMSRIHAHRLIESAVVVANLMPSEDQAELLPNGNIEVASESLAETLPMGNMPPRISTPTEVPRLLPTSERQARPLAALPPEQQREAWERAVETALHRRTSSTCCFGSRSRSERRRRSVIATAFPDSSSLPQHACDLRGLLPRAVEHSPADGVSAHQRGIGCREFVRNCGHGARKSDGDITGRQFVRRGGQRDPRS